MHARRSSHAPADQLNKFSAHSLTSTLTMSSFFALFLVVLLLHTVSPAPVKPPAGWTLLKAADPKETITVTLAVKQANREWLDTTLRSVSYPDSPYYGQHKTLEEIATHVHAHPESVAAVKKLFQSVNVEASFTIGEGFAVANIPIEIAEQLFSAKFYQFQYKDKSDVTTTRTLGFTVPSYLKPHVDFVCCMDQFPEPERKTKLRSYGLPQVSPSSIDKSYNISGYSGTNTNNSQAIAGFLKQYFNPSDLKTFQQEFDVPINPIVKVIGKNNEELPGGEASLDVQYITATGRNVPTWFISVSTYSNGKQEGFIDWLTILSNTTNVPWVHSISYGDNENTVEDSYLQRCEDEFKKQGIAGRTLLFASGDSGVTCKKDKFHPDWPASSPSVTTVGGTVSMTAVWASGGGGFSDFFDMPDYQKDAIAAYLNSGKAPNKKYFNAGGRGYPDVSAFATGFIIYVDGMVETVGGTSCAAPTTAGIISLINDVRLNGGKSTVGFLNPLIYKLNGKGFFDITKGENYGNNPFCDGFKAIEGWDPASGWGSPNFGILKGLLN